VSTLPNWRHMTVAFVSGALVAALVGLQWVEWRRRRQAATAPEAPAPTAEPPPAGSGHPADQRVVQG
jgi:hypothetical protein